MSNAITIPAETVKLLRASVLNELGNVASDIAQLTEPGGEEDPRTLPELLDQLDGHRALLGAIGHQQPQRQTQVHVDLSAHSTALRAAIDTELAVHREFLDVDPNLTGAATQRENAQRHIDLLEALLTDLTSRQAPGDSGHQR